MNSNRTFNITDVILINTYILESDFYYRKELMNYFKRFLILSYHPIFHSCVDPVRSTEFELLDAEVIWGNNDFCYPIFDLYNDYFPLNDVHLVAG